MEEKILVPTANYVGYIDEVVYIDLVYPAGFNKDTVVSVETSSSYIPLNSKIEKNFASYNDNTSRTLTIEDTSLNAEYIVTILSLGAEPVTLNVATKEPDAQIAKNVNVNSYGSRLIEVLFDEPMQNLPAVFDFAANAISLPATPKDINDSSILSNLYFRYYGSDDEGTLYQPSTQPIDWLGYFAGHDISVRLSPDNRRLEVQFNDYDLPDGTTHQLILNYSKKFPGLSNNYRIQDANNNIFPIVSSTVSIEKSAQKAILTNIEALSRTDLLLTYSKEVLLIDETNLVHDIVNVNPITINGFEVTQIERFENSYTQILCKLDPDVYYLPLGDSVPVKVSPTMDACGYLTAETTILIPVHEAAPNVTSLSQSSKSDSTHTVLDISFDQEMASVSSLATLTPYFNIYNVTDGSPVKINAEIIECCTDANDYKLSISISNPILYSGYKYQIDISDLENKLDTVMNPFSKVITIVDTTAPQIDKILLSLETARIVVTFDEPMTTNGSNSVTDPENYILLPKVNPNFDDEQCSIDPTTAIKLDEKNTESITNLLDDTLVRIVCNDSTPVFSVKNNNASHFVKVGYCDIKTVHYVTNISGNVLDFVCPTDAVVVRGFKSSEFATQFIDAETITLNFTGVADTDPNIADAMLNQIFDINPADFTLTGNGFTAVQAISAKISNKGKSVTLEFPTDTITVSGLSLVLKPTQTVDIFGNPLPELNIALTSYSTPTILKELTLLDTVGDLARFLVKYSNDVMIEPGVPSTVACRDYSIEVTDGNGNVTPGRPAKNMSVNGNEVLLDFENLNNVSIQQNFKFKIGITASSISFNTVEAAAPHEIVDVFDFAKVSKGYYTRPYVTIDSADTTTSIFTLYVDDFVGSMDSVDLSPVSANIADGIASFPTNAIFDSLQLTLDQTTISGNNAVILEAYKPVPNPYPTAIQFKITVTSSTSLALTGTLEFKVNTTILSVNSDPILTNRNGSVAFIGNTKL